MTTDDPVPRPLPDFNILEMQWFLQRTSALARAAEVYDGYDSDDIDSDCFRDDFFYDEDL